MHIPAMSVSIAPIGLPISLNRLASSMALTKSIVSGQITWQCSIAGGYSMALNYSHQSIFFFKDEVCVKTGTIKYPALQAMLNVKTATDCQGVSGTSFEARF